MYTFIVGIILLVAVLLIFAVLAQNSKGGGLTGEFGGQVANQMFGAKKGADLLERITWGFAITIFVLSLSTTFLTTSLNANDETSPNLQKAQEKKAVMPTTPNPQNKDAKPETKPSQTPTKTDKKEEKK